MDFLTGLLLKTILQVWTTFQHNWPFLLISVLVAVALKLYIDPNKVSRFLIRYRKAGVIGVTAAAVATPLCSCGTTAIVLGMMAGMMPWAPIVAFMVASPLTSPEELVYSAGLFGWPFALAFFIASICLGLLGGLAAGLMENRGWLANQNRMGLNVQTRTFTGQSSLAMQPVMVAACACEPVLNAGAVSFNEPVLAGCGCESSPVGMTLKVHPRAAVIADTNCACSTSSQVSTSMVGSCGCASIPEDRVNSTCGCGDSAAITSCDTCGCQNTPAAANSSSCSDPADTAKESKPDPITLRMFWNEAVITGRRLLVMFLGFAFIGYFLNGLIPTAWVAAIFGKGNIYSIPLAATLGLPLYINTEASLPLVRALIDGGMSQGAALAFLITGAGTSFGAVAGMLAIARWRVIALVIGTLWVGAVATGYLFNLFLALHLI